jgi:predicted kinase
MKLDEIATQRLLIVPIGPSGAGKSTLFNQLKQQHPDLVPYSFDSLRHEWYDPNDYSKAWKASTEDKSFFPRVKENFADLIRAGKSVYVDNTNLSPKARKFFVEKAKEAGYRTIAYVFDVDVDTLLQRQRTRPDKQVPDEAVRQHVAAMKPPTPGEFHEVRTV